jgi:hypothetical protein
MISRAVLEKVCSPRLEQLQPWPAFDACRQLGRLARWWLRPEVLRLASSHDPTFSSLTSPDLPSLWGKTGSCWVVFVRKDGALPLLREAFLLPLRWRRGQDHARCMPEELRSLAEEVVSQVGERERWGLWPGEELYLDEAGSPGSLGLTYASGWASLSAGLILARKDLAPRTAVWASGVWGPDGLQEVDGLEAKLRLARDWSARWFFVPVWQVSSARRTLQEIGFTEMEVSGLEATNTRKPVDSLRAYLARLGGEPQAPDPADETGKQFEICKGYYQLLPYREPSARFFYRTHLLPTIAHRCRKEVSRNQQLTHLITIASDSNELILLAVRMLRAKRVLILYTPEYSKETQQTLEELKAAEEEAQSAPVAEVFTYGDDMEQTMLHHIRPFLDRVPLEQVVFDLTPGTKLMTLTLEHLGRREFPSSWLLYLKHRTPNGRPEPGAEFPLLWRAGE